jgi:universal stress protein E
MKSSNIILAGIDFSDSSAIVLRHALHAAGASGSRLVAVHVLDAGLREHRDVSGMGNPGFDTLKKEAEGRFAELLEGNVSEVEVQFSVKIGKPAEELGVLAGELGARYLIISANDLTKKRLGSIAARCLRTVQCDVLVLRDWQGGDFRKIVMCTDFSKTADTALARAASLAGGSGARLEIVYVMYPPGRDSWGKALEHAADSAMSYEEECKAEVQAKLDQWMERNEAVLKDVKHEVLILESEVPSIKITDHVVSTGADLVVMGTHGHSPIMSLFLGTNAERLLHDAPVSVFAVR